MAFVFDLQTLADPRAGLAVVACLGLTACSGSGDNWHMAGMLSCM